MMFRNPVTPKNFYQVMIGFFVWYHQQSAEEQRLTCNDFDDFLDNLADQDAFGTEGQLDPRGDQRD